MSPRSAGLTLGLAHLALVAGVGLKFSADRATLPRGWARTVPFDPSLPIRGRYVRLRLEVPLAGEDGGSRAGEVRTIRLRSRGDRLEAVLDSASRLDGRLESSDGGMTVQLNEPIAFFIPEHIPDPSVRPPGQELWAELTVPRRGPPRPVRLGVRSADRLEPLEIR